MNHQVQFIKKLIDLSVNWSQFNVFFIRQTDFNIDRKLGQHENLWQSAFARLTSNKPKNDSWIVTILAKKNSLPMLVT